MILGIYCDYIMFMSTHTNTHTHIKWHPYCTNDSE